MALELTGFRVKRQVGQLEDGCTSLEIRIEGCGAQIGQQGVAAFDMSGVVQGAVPASDMPRKVEPARDHDGGVQKRQEFLQTQGCSDSKIKQRLRFENRGRAACGEDGIRRLQAEFVKKNSVPVEAETRFGFTDLELRTFDDGLAAADFQPAVVNRGGCLKTDRGFDVVQGEKERGRAAVDFQSSLNEVEGVDADFRNPEDFGFRFNGRHGFTQDILSRGGAGCDGFETRPDDENLLQMDLLPENDGPVYVDLDSLRGKRLEPGFIRIDAPDCGILEFYGKRKRPESHLPGFEGQSGRLSQGAVCDSEKKLSRRPGVEKSECGGKNDGEGNDQEDEFLFPPVFPLRSISRHISIITNFRGTCAGRNAPQDFACRPFVRPQSRKRTSFS